MVDRISLLSRMYHQLTEASLGDQAGADLLKPLNDSLAIALVHLPLKNARALESEARDELKIFIGDSLDKKYVLKIARNWDVYSKSLPKSDDDKNKWRSRLIDLLTSASEPEPKPPPKKESKSKNGEPRKGRSKAKMT